MSAITNRIAELQNLISVCQAQIDAIEAECKSRQDPVLAEQARYAAELSSLQAAQKAGVA